VDSGFGSLDLDTLAAEAGVSTEYVQELTTAGAIRADPVGSYLPDDIPRVRLAAALAGAGIDTDALMWAIRSGILQLAEFRGIWRVAAPGGRHYAEFKASLGSRGAQLGRLYLAFGLVEPPDEAPIADDEASLLTAFLETWDDVDPSPDLALRAARIAGEGIRRLQLATIDLFDEWGGAPPQRMARGMSSEDAFRPSMRLGTVVPQLLLWLQARHLESELFGRIVLSVQSRLMEEGRIKTAPREPPAVAFVDLSGYTAATIAAGDKAAAEFSTHLETLAADAVRPVRGQIVKLLGDGIMMRFRRTFDGCSAVLSLMDGVEHAGLPAAHAGMAAGPLVVRDGDVYGSTVNLAARIAAHASAGEFLVNDLAAQHLADAGQDLQDAGDVALKGVPEPVKLARLRR
jgi:adenylate cyclase